MVMATFFTLNEVLHLYVHTSTREAIRIMVGVQNAGLSTRFASRVHINKRAVSCATSHF